MRLIDARKLKKSAEFVRIDGALKAVVLYSDIMNAPTVDAVPVVHGEWIKDRDGDEYCDNCSRYMPVREVTGDPSANNFCPNCGADMRERKGDEC